MAVPTNTVSTVSAIGNREDLVDVIYDISPMDTPFLSEAQKGRATSVFHEWQTDALDAAAANRQVEGDDATANTFAATTRVGNYCQISRKVISVSGTQRSVDSAGRADEFAYQVAKRGREIKRDMEFALTRNQASSAGGATTARSLASLESWLATNKTSAGTGTAQTTPGFSSGTVAAPTDSTVAGAFIKGDLDQVIEECWNQGGDPKVIMVGAHNRGVVSGFSGISTLETSAEASGDVTLIGAVDFYKSNFGTLKVVPNRFQRDQTALVLDMEFLGVSMLRDMEFIPLSKTGDSDREMILSEYTLQVQNEAASGKITDLTTS
jgi:hypothetical protein